MRAIIFLSVLISAQFALSAGVDPEAEKAFREVAEKIQNPLERPKLIDNSDAKKTVDRIKEMSNGDKDTEQAIYQLSAELMPLLLEQSGGDPQKMANVLAEAQRNPAAFADKFTPAQRQRLQDLAKKMDQHTPK